MDHDGQVSAIVYKGASACACDCGYFSVVSKGERSEQWPPATGPLETIMYWGLELSSYHITHGDACRYVKLRVKGSYKTPKHTIELRKNDSLSRQPVHTCILPRYVRVDIAAEILEFTPCRPFNTFSCTVDLYDLNLPRPSPPSVA